MEGSTLHPEVIDGVNYFTTAEIDAVACNLPAANRTRPRLDDGQVAARVFRLIDKGKELRGIVEELEVSRQLVRTLYHEWKTDFIDGEQERRRAAEEAAEQGRSRLTNGKPRNRRTSLSGSCGKFSAADGWGTRMVPLAAVAKLRTRRQSAIAVLDIDDRRAMVVSWQATSRTV